MPSNKSNKKTKRSCKFLIFVFLDWKLSIFAVLGAFGQVMRKFNESSQLTKARWNLKNSLWSSFFYIFSRQISCLVTNSEMWFFCTSLFNQTCKCSLSLAISGWTNIYSTGLFFLDWQHCFTSKWYSSEKIATFR